MKAERAEKNGRSSLEHEFPGSPITVRQQLMRSWSTDCLFACCKLVQRTPRQKCAFGKGEIQRSLHISNVSSDLEKAESPRGAGEAKDTVK